MARGVCLGVEREPQPSPARHEGGDCFACSVIAALGYLYPERRPTFEQTDRWFRGEWARPYGTMEKVARAVAAGEDARDEARELVARLDGYDREPPTSNDWRGIQKALDNARFRDGYDIEYRCEMNLPQFDPDRWGYGWSVQFGSSDYARMLEAWLSAGYVAITSILYSGEGPLNAELKIRSPDHFVVLDGVRQQGDDAYWNNPEIHVVCSARGTYWIDSMTWCRGYGGVPWLLIRRRD